MIILTFWAAVRRSFTVEWLWFGCGLAVVWLWFDCAWGAGKIANSGKKRQKTMGFCIIFFASDRPPGGKFFFLFFFLFFLVPQKIETKLTNNDRQLHWQPGGPLSDTPCGGKPLGGFNRFAHSAGPVSMVERRGVAVARCDVLWGRAVATCCGDVLW